MQFPDKIFPRQPFFMTIKYPDCNFPTGDFPECNFPTKISPDHQISRLQCGRFAEQFRIKVVDSIPIRARRIFRRFLSYLTLRVVGLIFGVMVIIVWSKVPAAGLSKLHSGFRNGNNCRKKTLRRRLHLPEIPRAKCADLLELSTTPIHPTK